METTVTRFPLEELVKLPSFYYPVVSWDGTQVAYYSDQSGRMEIWVQDLESGAAKQVSRGQVPAAIHGSFIWDRAGTTIIFPRDEGGNEQHDLWSLDIASGEAQRITDAPGQEIPVEVSPDDSEIAFISTRNGQLNLFVTKRDGSDTRQVTFFDNPVWSAVWSPDGRQIAFTSNESPDPHNVDIFLVSAAGGEARRIYSDGEGTQDEVIAWSPDGASLVINSDASGVNRAGLLDLESGSVRWFGAEGIEETATGISRNGRLMLALRNREASMRPVVYDIANGAERVLSLPSGTVQMPLDAAFGLDDRAIVVRYSSDTERPALLRYDLESSEGRVLLAPEYGSIDPAVFVPAEDVYYPSFDGLRIHALLYRPHDIPEGERAPAVVMPHGGPTWQYFHGFDPYVQFLVNDGYVVLAPNVRGSTGYGVEFRDMARHDWGGADLQDIVAGRDYLAALPFVDPDRIAVFGGSYGGFMTYIAVTKAPEKWKAGVAWVGVSDLPAMYEESMPHYKHFLEEQMGSPTENAALWRDRSAANFADRTTAKLLIVHGINDPRCPISQARIFRDRLLAAGKQEGRDFEYVELGEEGHGSTDREQRLRAFRLVGDFLGRNL
ncbi:MAG TPA: S9 family peptidase [Chloroflexota bacterium]|nr:S9 family peptidase [Chloroflexota bacterium]